MRIRQVKPAFWGDSLLSSLPEPTRLFYIGLWMLADDAGWIAWDTAEVGRELYGYETRARRERRVSSMLYQLRDNGRVIVHPCGHVEVPNLIEHQRLGGPTKQVYTVLNDHKKRCIASSPRIPADARDSPLVPARNGKERERVGERYGKERLGTVGAQEREETTSEFRTLAAWEGKRP